MVGKFIDRWEDLWEDVWKPLGDLPEAPFDLYAELYRAASANMKRESDDVSLVQVVTNPDKAFDAFRTINRKSFKGEIEIVAFLEDAYDSLDEFGIPKLTNRYVKLMNVFIKRFNLRYQLVSPFSLQVQIPWIFADVYTELNQINKRDSHLAELMNDFENAFDTFTRTKKRRDLRTSIAKASNYAEGVAATRLKLAKGGSLGEMCDLLANQQVWPHVGVQNTLKELYTFCNDYPGIRHGGTKNSKKRELVEKDTIIISALLIAFSGYINDQVNIKKILTG